MLDRRDIARLGHTTSLCLSLLSNISNWRNWLGVCILADPLVLFAFSAVRRSKYPQSSSAMSIVVQSRGFRAIVTYFKYIYIYLSIYEILSLTYPTDRSGKVCVLCVGKKRGKKKKKNVRIEKSMTHQSCFQTWKKHFDRTNSRTILPRITIYIDPPISPAFSETIKFE